MIQSVATVAAILGFLICIAAAMILAFMSESAEPEA